MSMSALDLESSLPERSAAPSNGHRRVHSASASHDDPAQSDLVGQYMRSISAVPVLTREDQTALGRELAAAADRFRTLVIELPSAALTLWKIWRDRKVKGYSMSPMSIHYRDGSGQDHGARIDSAFEKIGDLLDHDDSGEPIRATKTVHQATIVPLLHAADIATPCLLDGLRARVERDGALETDAAQAREAASAYEDFSRLRARFTLHNTKLVIMVAKRFRNMGVPFLDLIQEGNRGLMRAVELFDAERGNAFSTYAVWWIRQSLIRALQTQARSVRIPSKLLDLGRKGRETTAKVAQKTFSEPGMVDLADELGVDEQRLSKAMAADSMPMSIDAPLPGTEDLKLSDTLEDLASSNAEYEIDRELIENRVQNALVGLPEREREVIRQRFGMGDWEPCTLQSIATRMGISRERVRQLETRALEELRACSSILTVARDLDIESALAS
jgi:RNA polymerase primary sigma factor